MESSYEKTYRSLVVLSMTVGIEPSGAGKKVHVMLYLGTGGWASEMLNFRVRVPLSIPVNVLFTKPLERTGGAEEEEHEMICGHSCQYV